MGCCQVKPILARLDASPRQQTPEYRGFLPYGARVSRRFQVNLTVPFVVLAFVACAPAAEEAVVEEPDIEQDDHAIRALLTQATEADNQEDADAWTDLFTEDAVLMPQGCPAPAVSTIFYLSNSVIDLTP